MQEAGVQVHAFYFGIVSQFKALANRPYLYFVAYLEFLENVFLKVDEYVLNTAMFACNRSFCAFCISRDNIGGITYARCV